MEFDLTPEQYHGGVDKLWNALKLTEVQNKDVFTLTAERIEQLESDLTTARQTIAETQEQMEKALSSINMFTEEGNFQAKGILEQALAPTEKGK